MHVRVGVHEELLVHRQEVVCGVHASEHPEGVVHLSVQRVVLRLGVVVGLGAVVEVGIDGFRSVGRLVAVVDRRVLTYAENTVHVLLGDLVVRELEAELVVAQQRQLCVGAGLVLRPRSSGLVG